MRHIEDQLQKSIVRWFDLQYANLRHLLIHVPNGGYRNAVEAAKFKQMGVRAGVPDLILLYPNKEHPFMGIELKAGKTDNPYTRRNTKLSLVGSAPNMSLSVRSANS